MSPHRRLPISTRHAFALAFDLAVRRDSLQSLVVPLLLRAPWILAAAMLPDADEVSDGAVQVARWTALVLFRDAVTSLLVAGMLRFRARSVFNTPPGTAPGPVLASYGASLARLPWLFVTEFARNLAFVLANLFLVLPGVYLGFKLSLATEIVVLHRVSPGEAFATSFRLTEARFERWLELLALSVVVVLTACFIPVVTLLRVPCGGMDAGPRARSVPRGRGDAADPVRVDVLLPAARGGGAVTAPGLGPALPTSPPPSAACPWRIAASVM